MGYEQSISNKEKSNNGNSYEKYLFEFLEQNQKSYGINSVKKQYIECGTELNNEIFLTIKELEKKGSKITEALIKKVTKTILAKNKDQVIRTKQRYNKRSDIRFTTNYEYIDSTGSRRNMEVIIDTTTSARGDRIKAKAQDAMVYKKTGIDEIYIIVLPDDEFFDKKGYNNPEYEKKCCKTECYNNNFANLYKDEHISLILQEKDFLDFLTYIKKRKGQKMDKLIENFKKYQFKDSYAKRKEDLKILEETLIDEMIEYFCD